MDQISISCFTRWSGLTKLFMCRSIPSLIYCCLVLFTGASTRKEKVFTKQQPRWCSAAWEAGWRHGQCRENGGAGDENIGRSLWWVSLAECCRFVWTIAREECKWKRLLSRAHVIFHCLLVMPSRTPSQAGKYLAVLHDYLTTSFWLWICYILLWYHGIIICYRKEAGCAQNFGMTLRSRLEARLSFHL
jgi:hypothetical protein